MLVEEHDRNKTVTCLLPGCKAPIRVGGPPARPGGR
jgi:hypothetical protein